MEPSKGVKSSNEFISFEVTSDGKLSKLRKKSSSLHIDNNLSAKALDNEVKYLKKAKEAGVNVPHVHDYNPEDLTFKMDFLHDKDPAIRYLKTISEDKEKGSSVLLVANIFSSIGEVVGKLHNAGILHGSLDLNHIMVDPIAPHEERGVYLIGFNSSTASENIDDKAVDLKLFSRLVLIDHSLETDFPEFKDYFENFREGYKITCSDEKQVLQELDSSKFLLISIA